MSGAVKVCKIAIGIGGAICVAGWTAGAVSLVLEGIGIISRSNPLPLYGMMICMSGLVVIAPAAAAWTAIAAFKEGFWK